MTNSKSKPVGHKPAGGAFGKNVKQVKLRTGKPNRAMNPAAVNQFGNHVGSAAGVAKLDAGKAISPPLGNTIATNVGTGGPGKGRTLYGQSGMQAQHGKSAGNVNEGGRKPIFPGFE